MVAIDRLTLQDAFPVYRLMSRSHHRSANLGATWHALLAQAAVAEGLDGHTWLGAIEAVLTQIEAGEEYGGWASPRAVASGCVT